MVLQADPKRFELTDELARGVRGKRVFISGAGKDGGLGQAFALAAAMGGAKTVGVHFHNSWADGIETVELIRKHGGEAFPVQADVTNPGDVWAMRSHVMRNMGNKPPDLVICNSGLTESGYLLGRVPKEVDAEPPAKRRARVRQAFVNNLQESDSVLDTKINGFLAVTHLWASEAVFANEPIDIVYISSRQAVDPAPGVPGYAAANWAVLALPRILQVNLGRRGDNVRAFSVAYPFVRTGMTDALADNEKVFGRWQPRMLETDEAAKALMQLLARPRDELAQRTFQLDVEKEQNGAEGIRVSWSEVAIGIDNRRVDWSDASPLRFSLDRGAGEPERPTRPGPGGAEAR